MSHFSRCDLLKLVTIPVNFGLKKSLVPTFPWPFPRRKVFAGLVLKSAKLDKNIAKILLVGLKSAKYGQEYRDFGALKSAKIVQTLVGASRGLSKRRPASQKCERVCHASSDSTSGTSHASYRFVSSALHQGLFQFQFLFWSQKPQLTNNAVRIPQNFSEN